MSKIVDYSKWDHLEDSDEDEPPATITAQQEPAAAAPPAPEEDVQATPVVKTSVGENQSIATTREQAGPEGHVMDARGDVRSVGSLTPKGTEKGRYQFKHEGRVIYEWDQNLEDVNIYITPPPGVVPDMIDCTIKPNHLRLGLVGNPPFLDEATGGPVVVKESHWYMNDGELTVLFSKMRKGETWDAALATRGKVDPFTRQEIQREMMLERFQEENPGFDFRSAEFNGQVPDPRNFMGGVKYS